MHKMTLKKHVEILEMLEGCLKAALAQARTSFQIRLGQRINEYHDIHLTCPVLKVGPCPNAYDRAIEGTQHGSEARISAIKAYRRSLREEAERLLPLIRSADTGGMKLAVWVDTSFEINVKPARPTGKTRKAAV